MSWKTITNETPLRKGDLIRVHNGYEYNEVVLGDFELERGFALTGMHNETASLRGKNFGMPAEIWVEPNSPEFTDREYELISISRHYGRMLEKLEDFREDLQSNIFNDSYLEETVNRVKAAVNWLHHEIQEQEREDLDACLEGRNPSYWATDEEYHGADYE